MSLFSKKQEEPASVETGVDVLRKTLRARNRTPNAVAALLDGGVSANDIHLGKVPGVNPAMLDSFLAGSDNLSTEQLKALARALFPHSRYNEESGLLEPANQVEPTTLHVDLTPWPKQDIDYSITETRTTPLPTPVGLRSYSDKRPGWKT